MKKIIIGAIVGLAFLGACTDEETKPTVTTTTLENGNSNSCIPWHPPCKRNPEPGDMDFIGPILGPDPRHP